MHKRTLLCASMLVALGVAGGPASAASVCYERVLEPTDTLRFAVKFETNLTGRKETPQQRAYSIIGQRTDTRILRTIALRGTVVVARDVGAVLDTSEGFQSSLFICSSDDPSPTPAEWDCGIDGSDKLRMVDPADNPGCSAFLIFPRQ